MTRMKESGIDWIGQIPEEWEVAKVNHIFEEHKQKNRGNKEKNLLSLSYGRIIQKSIDSFFGLLPESFDTYNIIQRGDIVLRLTDLQNDKRSLRVGLARENGIITSAYLTLRLKNLESNDSYMYYLLHTYDICKVFYNFGGGVRQGGTWSDIYKMELLNPPCNEQQKIADFLDKKTAQLDKVKGLLEEQIQKLKDYRASLIYETVTKGLDKTVSMKDSGIDWIGQVPQRWGVKAIKYIFDEIGSGSTPKSDNEIFYDGDINWIQSGDLYQTDTVTSVSKTISYQGFNSTSALKIYQPPFVALAMYGASVGNVAVSYIDACVNQAVVVMLGASEKVRFGKYAIEASKNNLIFSAQGGTQPNISQNLIKNWSIPQPKNEEQEQIADFLDEKTVQIDKLIQIKNKQIENINKQRQTLIFDYVTGKRRV
ncbi:restriction endonuclease subunit S [Streptococcus salivarius]|uniref:restriction endonuclease subunit S n=1 Tax=Streptococcus salivarius TaxID=1304 RepID=UPI00187C4197|nr:restriction endonuclease subunit S [Streptococcus salivarius]MBE7885121.1 restriction endonuclease subunit S [Streptococcus salivarius]